jgi:hypothetical protein
MAIKYSEKGSGLHAAIGEAGHWLRQNNGVWECSDETAVQAIIDGYSLSQVANDICTEIDTYAKTLRDRVISNISPGEMASWPIKLAEAAKYAQSGSDTDAPMLALEASARGVTIAELCLKVTGNAGSLASVEAAIAGTSGKHRDAVRACTTWDAIAAYDWRTGWPAV